MNKQQFFEAMNRGDLDVWPDTEEKVVWFEEWLALNPAVKNDIDSSYNKLNEKQAAEYMCLKIFARTFIETNGEGIYLAQITGNKITISKGVGKIAKDYPKLEIEL